MKFILLRNPKYTLNNNYGWASGYRIIPVIVEGIVNEKNEQLITSILFKEIKAYSLFKISKEKVKRSIK
jgi:hypothetical protein